MANASRLDLRSSATQGSTGVWGRDMGLVEEAGLAMCGRG